MQLTERHLEYWSKNLKITAVLLFIWFVATFVLGYFARDLSFNFFGWTFAFYMAAQGGRRSSLRQITPRHCANLAQDSALNPADLH